MWKLKVKLGKTSYGAVWEKRRPMCAWCAIWYDTIETKCLECAKQLMDSWLNVAPNQKQKKQSNRRYHTSPALCNPTTPFATDRPHRLRPEITNTICMCLAYWVIPSAAWCYWRLNDPCCSKRDSDATSVNCSEDCQRFKMARTTPKNCPFTLGICTPI